jgi:NAD(P)-dependent dehydrogenase (short-subunit alcohol dehydrogenase family)
MPDSSVIDSFVDKIVIVTGAARGIGKNIATTFAESGSQVIIVDINESLAKSVTSELCYNGLRADYLVIDLAKKGEPQRMVSTIAQKFGRLDVLVNNARAGIRHEMLSETEENWDLTCDVILRAAYFAAQTAVPIMAANGGGSIVNIVSVAAHQVSFESPAYHASKAGLLQVTRYLAVKAGKHGVRVNGIMPGFIVQDEHQVRFYNSDNAEYRSRAEICHPVGCIGTSNNVAEATLFLCSKGASFITGHCIVVDGGLSLQDNWTAVTSFSESYRSSL